MSRFPLNHLRTVSLREGVEPRSGVTGAGREHGHVLKCGHVPRPSVAKVLLSMLTFRHLREGTWTVAASGSSIELIKEEVAEGDSGHCRVREGNARVRTDGGEL